MGIAGSFMGALRSVAGPRWQKESAPPLDPKTEKEAKTASEIAASISKLKEHPSFKLFEADLQEIESELVDQLSDVDAGAKKARVAQWQLQVLRRIKNIIPERIEQGRVADLMLSKNLGLESEPELEA